MEVFGLEPNFEWIQSVFPLTAICCIFGCSNFKTDFHLNFQARKRGILDMDILYKKSVEQLKIVLIISSPVLGMELLSKLLIQPANQVMIQGMG